MADEWAEFSDADEWGEFADVPAQRGPRRTSQALGVYKGVMKPLDNVAMALEGGARAIGLPVDQINMASQNIFGSGSARDARDTRARAFEQSDVAPGAVGEVVGNVFGTLPFAAGGPVTTGAIGGALLTDAETPGGVARDMAFGAGLGWAGGKVVDAVSDAISPVIAPAARRLSDAGVRLTPGMTRGGSAMGAEDKLMSRPVVGPMVAAAREKTSASFVKASVDEALAPLGVKVPAPIKPGFDSLDYAKRTISQAYDRVVPQLSVRMNGQAFAAKVLPFAQTLEPAQRKTFQSLISTNLKNGQLDGQALKRAQSELRRLASNYGRDQAAANRELSRALWAADDELTAAMMAQNPKLAPELQRVNAAYRGYRIVADAAGRSDDGLFNTGQLKQSVRRGDRSANRDASARGEAFMQGFANDARTVLPARTPDSGTAGRQMAANPFAYVGGSADALRFGLDEAMNAFRLAPRPPGAARAAGAVRRLQAPVAAGAVALPQQR
jgi:hypothetical protein